MPDPSHPAIRERKVDAFARLTPLGWRAGLISITALLAASFFLAGYFIGYWHNADMDFMIVYSALLLNDGQPAFFAHPAYFTILSVKFWFQLLHYFHLLDTFSLSRMPSASNVPAFEAAMTDVIRSARVVAWLTTTAFVLVFACLARLLIRDWRIATFGTVAFAFSGGLQFHMRMLRSELIAGCFFAFALMILIACGATGNNLAAPRGSRRSSALRAEPGEQGSCNPINCHASPVDPAVRRRFKCQRRFLGQ